MRYFLRAAGNTFQVGSSRLTLNLKASEFSCRSFGGAITELGVSATPWVAFDFSALFDDVGGNGEEPPFREKLGISCSARCGEE